MRFLFRLDLSLHAGAGKKFGIWNFVTKHGLSQKARKGIETDMAVCVRETGRGGCSHENVMGW